MTGGRDDLLCPRVLGNESRSTGLESREQGVIVGVHRQHDDPERGILGAQPPHAVHAVPVGQPQVHHDDVRLIGRRREESVGERGRLRHD
jgi:hypothetical protein